MLKLNISKLITKKAASYSVLSAVIYYLFYDYLYFPPVCYPPTFLPCDQAYFSYLLLFVVIIMSVIFAIELLSTAIAKLLKRNARGSEKRAAWLAIFIVTFFLLYFILALLNIQIFQKPSFIYDLLFFPGYGTPHPHSGPILDSLIL